MSVSSGPFLTCFLTILFLTGYLYFILYYRRSIIYYGIKLIFIGIAFILLRTLLPINFPFTISIYFEKLLSPLQSILNLHIRNSPLSVFDIVLVLWLVVSFYKLTKLIFQYIQYPRYLKPFLLKDWNSYPPLKNILDKNTSPSLQVAIVPVPCSPAITGLHRPILVLPNQPFSKEELTYIITHEIKHYTNHDLWLKLILNIVTCFHWYNPLIHVLNRKLILAFELSNDEILVRNYTKEQKLCYAECILKASKLHNHQADKFSTLAFTNTNDSSLAQRIHFILSDDFKNSLYKKNVTLLLHSFLIGSILFLSLIFVPEHTSIPESIEQSTMAISPDNAYLLESSGEYLLYVDGKYIIKFSDIPEDFQNLPVKTQEENNHENKN